MVNVEASIGDQITTAIINFNIFSRDPWEKPQHEWDNDLEPSLPRVSNARNISQNNLQIVSLQQQYLVV